MQTNLINDFLEKKGRKIYKGTQRTFLEPWTCYLNSSVSFTGLEYVEAYQFGLKNRW